MNTTKSKKKHTTSVFNDIKRYVNSAPVERCCEIYTPIQVIYRHITPLLPYIEFKFVSHYFFIFLKLYFKNLKERIIARKK